MFEFGAPDYRWCCFCRGNIKAEAKYCRYCHQPVGSKLLLHKQAIAVSGLIDAAAIWLPGFNDIMAQLPEPFRARLREADEAAPPMEGLKPGIEPAEAQKMRRNSRFYFPYRPGVAELGLVWDLLLALHSVGISMIDICSDSRLRLLEISVGEVLAEVQMRQEELSTGKCCVYCSEVVLPSYAECRFCGGSDTPPAEIAAAGSSLIDEYDESLLRAILSWESAKRKLEDSEPLPAEVLQKYAITEEKIESQVLAIKSDSHYLPKSSWRERMQQLGLTPGYASEAFLYSPEYSLEYFCLEDVSRLARSLTPRLGPARGRSEEALIIIEHGLTRWIDLPTFDEQKRSLLSAKSLAYCSLKDIEKYKETKNQLDADLTKRLSDNMKSMLGTANSLDSLIPEGLTDQDPRKRLQALEQIQSQSLDRLSQLQESAELVPGLGNLLKSMNESLQASADLGKMRLQAEVALSDGDLRGAAEIYESMLMISRPDNDVPLTFPVSDTRSLLAVVQGKLGEPVLAESSFLKAVSEATDLYEATREGSTLSDVHHRFGNFLCDGERYVEARENLEKAFAYRKESRARLVTKGYLKQEDCEEGLSSMKTDYATVLRGLGLKAEAEEVELEAARLKEADEERTRQRAARSNNFFSAS